MLRYSLFGSVLAALFLSGSAQESSQTPAQCSLVSHSSGALQPLEGTPHAYKIRFDADLGVKTAEVTPVESDSKDSKESEAKADSEGQSESEVKKPDLEWVDVHYAIGQSGAPQSFRMMPLSPVSFEHAPTAGIQVEEDQPISVSFTYSTTEGVTCDTETQFFLNGQPVTDPVSIIGGDATSGTGQSESSATPAEGEADPSLVDPAPSVTDTATDTVAPTSPEFGLTQEVQVQPAQTQQADPVTGEPISDPVTQQVDPVTGQPFPAPVAQQVDPLTGRPILPATSTQVDPLTGQPILPATSTQVDPLTGEPIAADLVLSTSAMAWSQEQVPYTQGSYEQAAYQQPYEQALAGTAAGTAVSGEPAFDPAQQQAFDPAAQVYQEQAFDPSTQTLQQQAFDPAIQPMYGDELDSESDSESDVESVDMGSVTGAATESELDALEQQQVHLESLQHAYVGQALAQLHPQFMQAQDTSTTLVRPGVDLAAQQSLWQRQGYEAEGTEEIPLETYLSLHPSLEQWLPQDVLEQQAEQFAGLFEIQQQLAMAGLVSADDFMQAPLYDQTHGQIVTPRQDL